MQTHLVSTKRPSDLVDDVLVQRAHVGDQGAFEILVDRAFLSVSAHLPPFPMSALHEDSTVCEEMKLPSLFLEKESQYARSTDHEYRLGYLDNGDIGAPKSVVRPPARRFPSGMPPAYTSRYTLITLPRR